MLQAVNGHRFETLVICCCIRLVCGRVDIPAKAHSKAELSSAYFDRALPIACAYRKVPLCVEGEPTHLVRNIAGCSPALDAMAGSDIRFGVRAADGLGVGGLAGRRTACRFPAETPPRRWRSKPPLPSLASAMKTLHSISVLPLSNSPIGFSCERDGSTHETAQQASQDRQATGMLSPTPKILAGFAGAVTSSPYLELCQISQFWRLERIGRKPHREEGRKTCGKACTWMRNWVRISRRKRLRRCPALAGLNQAELRNPLYGFSSARAPGPEHETQNLSAGWAWVCW